MILLLNEESVVVEMLLALRWRIAKQMEVPVEWVEVKLSRDKHLFRKATFHPEASINLPSLSDPTTRALAEQLEADKPMRVYRLTKEQIGAELANLGTLVSTEITKRLKGLDG